MFHPKQETCRDSGGSDYFQVGHRNSGKIHLSCTTAVSLSLSLPVVMVVCEHSRRSKGFWQETDGAVKKPTTLNLFLSISSMVIFNSSLEQYTEVKSECAGRQDHSLQHTSGIQTMKLLENVRKRGWNMTHICFTWRRLAVWADLIKII